jgi:hypothetical protein
MMKSVRCWGAPEAAARKRHRGCTSGNKGRTLMLKRLGELVGLNADPERRALGAMRIPDVIDAHMKWKLALQQYVEGNSEEGIDPAEIMHEEQSLAGRWIHLHAADTLSGYGAFFTVRAKHAQCHVLAAEVVEKVQQGDRAGALHLMNERLLKISHELVYAMIDLDRQLAAG